MGWTDDTAQCPCNKCAGALPTPTLLSQRQRTTHKKVFGLPLRAPEVFSCEDDAKSPPHLLEPGPAPEHVPKALQDVDEELFAKDLVLLTINHGISWKAAELIVKLVNAHVAGRTLHDKLPATAYQLKKLTNCRPGNAKLLHVCPACDFVFDDHQQVCTPCGLPPRIRVKRQVLVNDIRATIQQLFAIPRLAEAFAYASIRKPGDGDVWDGRVMRGIPLGTTHIYHHMILVPTLYDTSTSIAHSAYT